ncbi:MAG: TIGR02594 family protein, partial [Pseudolabrys sp.]|nr:TIGR02594 family protein [Pseudolabrys sp.]
MSPFKKRLALALCGVTLAACTTQALAKPRHGRSHHVARIKPLAGATSRPTGAEPQVTGNIPAEAVAARADASPAEASVEHGRQPDVVAGSGNLVDEARRYIGGNPTGRSSLWCGAFMDMVLKRTGHAGGGNLARGYARYGTRVAGPAVGAIAVMGRHGGGHVGVVSGVDANGNPIIISGNHNHRVAESVYPKGRIITYVMPN